MLRLTQILDLGNWGGHKAHWTQNQSLAGESLDSRTCFTALFSLFFYCYIINYHTVNGLKQHIYYLKVSVGQESRHGLIASLLRASHAEMEGLGQLCPHLKAPLGENLLPNPPRLLTEFIFVQLKDWGSYFNMAAHWGLVSAPRGHPSYPATWPSSPHHGSLPLHGQ